MHVTHNYSVGLNPAFSIPIKVSEYLAKLADSKM